MHVRIWSHWRGQSWEGEVNQRGRTVEGVNEWLFREFNRVDDQDVGRLERMGYQLPSLSVDDRVTWNGRTFVVDTFGFREVTIRG